MEGTQKNHQENAEKVKPFKVLHMHLPPKYYIYKKWVNLL